MKVYRVCRLKGLPNLRFVILFLVATSVLLFRVLQFNGLDVLMDDAFISFRYAVNWARGLGLVYNPGERVEGYTNFLWVILLAIGVRLGIDITLASKVLSLLSAVGTIAILLLFKMNTAGSSHRDFIAQIFPALLFASMSSQARYVVSGMETLLFTFLLSLAVYLHLYSGNPFLSGLIFAILALTRPEGVLYFVLALLYQMIRTSSKHVFAFAGAFVGLYGIYFLWRYLYYGYPFPNTFYAKVGGLHWARIQRGWDLLCRVLSWWGIWPILALAFIEVSTRLFYFIRFRPLSSWWKSSFSDRKTAEVAAEFIDGKALFFSAVILAIFLYFIVVGGDFIVWFGPRFLLPVLPLLLLLCADGLLHLSQIAPVLLRRALRLILPVILFLNAWYHSWPGHFSSMEAFSVQMRGWAEMGRWIAANTPEDATIATDAAGLIPFYSERYSIDMFGLTDLHIAHQDVPITEQSIVAHEKYDPQYILQRKPDYIVSTWMDPEGRAVSAGLPLVEEDFNRCYKLIAVAKIRGGPPSDGQWVVVLSSYSSTLYEQGYVTGLFQRQCLP